MRPRADGTRGRMLRAQMLENRRGFAVQLADRAQEFVHRRKVRAVRDGMLRQRLGGTRNHLFDALFVETETVVEHFSAQTIFSSHLIIRVDEQQRKIAHPQSRAKFSVDAVLQKRAMFLRPRETRVRVVRLRRQQRASDSRRGLQSVMQLEQRVLERHLTIAPLSIVMFDAFRPARTISGFTPTAASSSECVMMNRAVSTARAASSRAASCRSGLVFTNATLRSMSSADQPRECAMYGNCGNTQPISAKKPSICPATACTLSCPPVMMNDATLFFSRMRSRIVTWFWMQFIVSTIL